MSGQPKIPDAELQSWAALRADDAGRLARELVSSRHALAVLKQIAAPRDCGCSPVCQCDSIENLKIEIDFLKDLALEAIAKAEGGSA